MSLLAQPLAERRPKALFVRVQCERSEAVRNAQEGDCFLGFVPRHDNELASGFLAAVRVRLAAVVKSQFTWYTWGKIAAGRVVKWLAT